MQIVVDQLPKDREEDVINFNLFCLGFLFSFKGLGGMFQAVPSKRRL